MTTHISARLAWHDSGWNGHICRAPGENTYCSGQYSYQKDLIEKKDVAWEQSESVCGQSCSKLDQAPPCIHSINAFGADSLQAFGPPPTWFRDTTQVKKWTLAPATVSVWPYEEMYKDEVKNPPKSKPHYNADLRREAANDFFEPLEENKSLIFYYANFSNPFSDEDNLKYVIVGVSRIKKIGAELLWDGQSDAMRDRYGPNAWFRDVTSHYPDQGMRIPYHRYMDQPNVLEKILLTPENTRDFKYATRHISDDGALSLIERFMEIAGALEEIGDTSENWEAHRKWLGSILSELWRSRGLYPGLSGCMNYLGFADGASYCVQQAKVGTPDDEIHRTLFTALENGTPPSILKGKPFDEARRRWRYLEVVQQKLLRETLPRFSLTKEQIVKILDEPEKVSIWTSHEEISLNPYILSEQYIGKGSDDVVTFSKIDYGMIPSPDIGESLISADDPKRLRALVVEQLNHLNQHTFQRAQQVLSAVNHRLDYLPDWKKAKFSLRHLEVEQQELEPAVIYKTVEDTLFLYLGTVFSDERLVEKTLSSLVMRPDIELRFPVAENMWRSLLTEKESTLAKDHPKEYADAVDSQVAICQGIFRKPLSVLAGEAGTGKTTLVKAVIAAIEKAHGLGTTVKLLAPTGKAADRLRERTGKDAQTVHSFLAGHGWLNENLTFKRQGGSREEGVKTLIIDESSMLDLGLLAALFRAVNWNQIQRIIFVGDPNQLPPIGTGKVFSDLIDWLRQEAPDNLAELKVNMRLIENRLSKHGTGILRLASLFRRTPVAETKYYGEQEKQEDELFERLQEGGEIDGDLRVLYWPNPAELEKILLSTLVGDMEEAVGIKINPERPWEIWEKYFSREGIAYPERSQILTPYRGESAGTEHLNQVIQASRIKGSPVEKKGMLGGITYFDKAIQIRNRTGRERLWAYNAKTRKSEQLDLFNGEIGSVRIHGFDASKWTSPYFHIEKFQVMFSRKEHLWVDYDSDGKVEDNLELAYAISVHKAQGSEFERVYYVVPKHRKALMWRELFYTGLTRAQRHCTLFIEEDLSPLERLRRREMSQLSRINSSLFSFKPVPEALEEMEGWYEEGKIHKALTGDMVRSKSEVIIANLLHEREIPFKYEITLSAPDGTKKLPDFTIHWAGETWYWEHEGMLHDPAYRKYQEAKHAWYKKHGFSDRLIITTEGPGFDSQVAKGVIEKHFM
ncbi:MAG: AAA family ATPase [Alphaproteobacteria bacterium]